MGGKMKQRSIRPTFRMKKLQTALLIPALFLLTGCITTGYEDYSEYQADYNDFQADMQGIDDYNAQRYEQYQDEYYQERDLCFSGYDEDGIPILCSENEGYSAGGMSECPTGYISPPSGCRIKGNISYDTGKKIYHIQVKHFIAIRKLIPYSEKDGFVQNQRRSRMVGVRLTTKAA
jgi:hypothetical protein